MSVESVHFELLITQRDGSFDCNVDCSECDDDDKHDHKIHCREIECMIVHPPPKTIEKLANRRVEFDKADFPTGAYTKTTCGTVFAQAYAM